jgi:glutamate N-acetyltransferase/amino-acid N-acetyltransferase
MTNALSPLAPKTFVTLPPIAGMRIATAQAGIKYAGRTDLLLLAFDRPVSVAGVFTRSKCPSAPVDFCKVNLAGGQARAVVVNSGNANAFTGKKGVEAVEMTAEAAAKAVGCRPDQIFLASTGVIGEPLRAERFAHLIQDMARSGSEDAWIDAAKAIMTTDTYPKLATRTVRIGGSDVVINGIAKGAGMIAPDMATMLSFICTDADVAPDVLQRLLSRATGPTFNSITVDSDTSTSDTVLLFATGCSGAPAISDSSDPRLRPFRKALREFMRDLALQVVRDGEGARKLVEITVSGAANARVARRIALSVANSPLVKTAVAGEDANWGRVVMAVGKAGEQAHRDRLAIWFGDVRVAVGGERDPDYSEEAASRVMRQDEIRIVIDVGVASGKATVWTCDLTKDYVAINGDYRS